MPNRSNILVIMSDQHSRHFLGCYGNDLVRTPNLDRLAAAGMRFDNTYCPAPVCCPSRMSFMTSRTPTHNQVWDNGHLLNPGTPTWAHALSIAGYETSLLGRMHFEGRDQYHGFENRPVGSMFAIHPGAPLAREKYPSGQDRRVMELSGRGPTTYQWMDTQITNGACDYISAHANADRPFAAVVGYVLPHCPFVAPKELFDYYFDKVQAPEVEDDQPAMIRWYRKSRKIDTPIETRRTRIALAAYYALCEFFDSQVGRVLQSLDNAGLADNTMVVYCSDHGEMAGEHGCWTKNTYYEGSVGVPMIARLPGVIPAGSSSEINCNLMDLGPTFADVAGAEHRPTTDGRSLWPTLTAGTEGDANWINDTYSEVMDPTGIPSRMIKSDHWKLWIDEEHEGQPPNVALFDLSNDPGELRNLADDAKFADVRDRLLAKVTTDWNPATIRTRSKALNADYSLVRQWGQVTQQRLPEVMPPPPADYEDSVDLMEQAH